MCVYMWVCTSKCRWQLVVSTWCRCWNSNLGLQQQQYMLLTGDQELGHLTLSHCPQRFRGKGCKGPGQASCKFPAESRQANTEWPHCPPSPFLFFPFPFHFFSLFPFSPSLPPSFFSFNLKVCLICSAFIHVCMCKHL